MATVYKCDRCSKIDKNKLHQLETVWVLAPANPPNAPQTKQYDLCTTCIGDFNRSMVQFMKVVDIDERV